MNIKAKAVDMVVTKIGAVAFMVAGYFVHKPDSIAKALPVIAIGLAIFIVGLPISANVWKDKVIELAKLKLGGSSPAGNPTEGQVG